MTTHQLRVGRTGLAIALAGMFMAGRASAGNADVCASPAEPFGAVHALSNATVFTCLQAGTLTIPALAAAGWEIVKVSPVAGSDSSGQPAQYYQLIIQSADDVFRDGFD